ncbi:MAG: SPOR domain-containing protein, partial [Bacteroidetes bacterium]|nr:SPOR domain-containing protein [Bacteroidota bacterium]
EQPVVRTDGPVAVVPSPAAAEPPHPAAPAPEPAKPAAAPANNTPVVSTPPPTAPPAAPASRPTTAPMQPVATERPQPTVRTPEPPAPVAPAAGTTLANDVFTLGEGVARRSGPIAVDAPMPQGVVFKVQIGAFRKALGEEAFSDMTPVTGEHTGNGLIRYTAGMFTSAESATKASQQVRERGYSDAFVVAYQDGKRIPLQQARRLVQGLSPVPGPDERPVVARPPAVIAPPAAQPPVAAPAEEAVLASYPASAEQVLAAFKPASDATAYYNDPSAAPAKQVETIRGLFFTVQVGVYSKPTALDRLFNITPLNSERTETGKIRYTTGIFLDLDRAKVRKDGTVALGVTDAFVTAYLNGKRIPMRDARALLARFGTAVLADPALVTR